MYEMSVAISSFRGCNVDTDIGRIDKSFPRSSKLLIHKKVDRKE